MTDQSTARFALPLLQPGQAQKEMSHNEALARLDLAVQASAIAFGTETPPPDPAPGDCWIVGAAPEGAWTDRAGALAGWTAAGWRFVAPRQGMRVWVAEAQAWAGFDGAGWTLGEAHGRVIVEGLQVVGSRQPGIADPVGGALVDTEARAAIAAILATLRGHGLVDTA